MSASGFTPIQLYRTTTAAAVPTAGNLADGELAINLTDEALYFKNAAGVVKLLADSSGALGTVTSVDVSGGTTGLTTSGGPITSSGTITLAGTLGVANGGTGTATAFTAGSVVFAGASGVYSQDNANFFWDNSNDRLGIGTATPSVPLDVTENGVNSGLGYSNVSKFVDGSGNKGLIVGYDNSAQTTVLTANSTSASSNMAFWTYEAGGSGWAERMRVTAAGNVGIGVSSPAERLDVAGNAKISSGSSFYWGDATSQITAVNGGAMRFLVGNGGEKMRIDSSGNVGIGTSNVLGKFSVQTAAASSLSIRDGAFITTTPSAMLEAWNTPLAASTVPLLARASEFRFGTDSGGSFVERMRIDSSGNVGIGVVPSASTTFPALEIGAGNCILGASGFVDYTSNAYYNGSYRYKANGAASYYEQTGGSHLWYNAASGTAGNAISFTERMRIDSSGNVGIGTSSPGGTYGKLTVAGGVRTVEDTSSKLELGRFSSGAPNSYIKLSPNSASLRFTNAADDTDLMMLTNAGNFLVGTTTSAARLTVVGSATVIGQTNVSARFSDDVNSTLLISHPNTAGNPATLTGNNQLAFATGTLGNIAERVRIDASGFVGIGTTIPAAYGGRLTVGDPGNAFSNNVLLLTQYATATLVADGVTAANGAQLDVSWASGGQGPLRFTFSSTERMRLTSAGSLLIGTTSTLAAGFKQNIQLDSGAGGTIYRNNGDGDYAIQFLNSAGGTSGWIQVNTSSTTYNSISDVRLKRDIVDAPDAASLIDAIQVRSFRWNVDDSEQRYGFVAQELVTVAPEAVSQPANPDEMMGVDYSKLVPMLVKEIQSLRARVAQLEGN